MCVSAANVNNCVGSIKCILGISSIHVRCGFWHCRLCILRTENQFRTKNSFTENLMSHNVSQCFAHNSPSIVWSESWSCHWWVCREIVETGIEIGSSCLLKRINKTRKHAFRFVRFVFHFAFATAKPPPSLKSPFHHHVSKCHHDERVALERDSSLSQSTATNSYGCIWHSILPLWRLIVMGLLCFNEDLINSL